MWSQEFKDRSKEEDHYLRKRKFATAMAKGVRCLFGPYPRTKLPKGGTIGRRAANTFYKRKTKVVRFLKERPQCSFKSLDLYQNEIPLQANPELAIKIQTKPAYRHLKFLFNMIADPNAKKSSS